MHPSGPRVRGFYTIVPRILRVPANPSAAVPRFSADRGFVGRAIINRSVNPTGSPVPDTARRPPGTKLDYIRSTTPTRPYAFVRLNFV